MDRKLVEDRCNELLRDFFKMNSIADNMAYSLDTELKCREAAQIFHQKYAHVFPSDIFADLLSDKMSELGLRPRRLGFDGDFEGYENIVLLFSDNYEQINNLRKKIYETFEVLDYDVENKPITLILEEMILSISKYVHQSKIWKDNAEKYAQDWTDFNVHFKDITFI